MKRCEERWSKWVNGEDHSIFAAFMRVILWVASLFYGAAVRARNTAYDAGLFKTHRVSVPVISIGNLSMGGTGKTTLVQWCAETLIAAGKKPAILSRGYGRRHPGSDTVIVSGESGGGADRSDEAARSGDEPLLLARSLKNVPVIVDTDRVRGAKFAVGKFKPDVLLLDDGFQHRRLGRDLDILCFDDALFAAPFQFPRGVLREPLSGIARARAAAMKSQNGKITRPFEIPAAHYRYRVREIKNFANGEVMGADWLKGRRVWAACAIARPEGFEKTLRDAGAEIDGMNRFPDHFAFEDSDLKALESAAQKHSAALVMTAKDAVKLPKSFPALIVEIGIEWMDGEETLKRILLEAAKK